MGGFPFGKFCFLHFSVVVCIAFSSSFRPPAALISARTALLHVRDFLLGAWSSPGSPFLFQVKIVLPLGRSQRIFGVCWSCSSASCAVLPCSALESAASFRGSPRWDLILIRKVLAPDVTRSWRICTISLTRSPSGVVARLARVPSPIHFLMVLSRDSLSVR